MAGSTRAELASSSLDGSSFTSGYPNGQRGAYSSSNLDRSGSFRESLENRMMVSGPMVSRNAAASAATASVETPSVTQYLSLEPFPMNELKNVRSGELRRVLGISVEDHSFGSLQSKPLPPVSWDELKRFRGGVEEVNSRAKERAKLIEESLVNLEKFRKKRQRNEIQSNEKSSNSTLLKLGSQMHQNPSDFAGQRLEERTKNGVPNKRVRSSMAEASLPYSLQPEGRNTLPVRQGTMLDKDKSTLNAKDKNMLRTCNGVPMPTDDKLRGLPAGGEGWDKKMKRKRSVGTMVNRTPPDGDWELKQATQQRHSNEPRPRSGDALGFRTGSSNGILGSNKMDGTSQLSGGSSRILARTDLANGSLSNDRRERSSGLDKERVTAKGSNKMNICDDVQLGSQSPLTKGKVSRAPRTGSGVVTNTSTFPRSSGGIDGLEQPSCLNKAQPLTGVSIRKRPLPTGSSSPPVSNWGSSHRREKISRTRRANVVSPVSNFDEAQAEGFVAPDVGTRLSSIESSGVLFNRAISNNTHLKLKPESVPSPAALSESEESGALETKAKEKGIGNGEFEEGTPNAAHKAATFVLPTKKNKVPMKEEVGDGVRRQGRSGRGTVQSKACLQLSKEKLGTGSLETAKPLKSGRLISDKLESRVGRPPSKKASDRKGSTRPVQIINSGSSDFVGESDDDREELLAVAKHVRNAICPTKSDSFWNLMEPIFALVSSEDFALLKHQINFAEELDRSFSNVPDADYNVMIEESYQVVPSHISQQGSRTIVAGLNKYGGTVCPVDDPEPVKAAPGKIETERWFERVIPLSQRLLSAIISEEGTDLMDNNPKQGDTVLQFSSDCSPYGTNSCVENESGSDLIKYSLEFDNDLGSQTNCYGDSTPCNGFASPSTTFRSPSNFISGDELLQENDGLVHPNNPDSGALCEYEQDKSNQREPVGTGLGTSPYQCQFEQMSLNDKILMELHSIGIYPDAVPDLAECDVDEIDKAVSELKIKLYQQVRKKKSQLCKLEKVIQERKECELRNLERLAMNRLVEVAGKKLMGGRGTHGSSHKSGASKVSKQLAMAFAKRTLARCRKYEETGQSCFRESILRDVLFSEPVYNTDEKNADDISSGIAPDMHVESRNCLFDSRVSASGVSSNMIERHGPIHKIDSNQLDPYQGLTHFSEQFFVRNDPTSNRGKKREVLLDDVVTDAASRVTPTLNSTLPSGAKCKKIDKEYNRDILTKNSAPKGSRPSLSTGRGERKTKAKPKQKIAQLSTSGHGLGRVPETINMLSPMREYCEMTNDGSAKLNPEVEVASSRNAQDLSKEMEDNIFTSLPLQGIHSIDELDVADGLGGQGQDIGSWLNVDDDALQDNDLVGLEIPMDDLSELNMNF